MEPVCQLNISIVSKKPPEDDEDFASLMSGVKRLQHDRVNLHAPSKRTSTPLRSAIDNDDSIQDFARLSYAQQNQLSDSYFDHGIQRKLQRKIRQGLLPLGDSLDLHGCTQKSAASELSQFIRNAQTSGYQTVVVIHGKGNRSSNSAVLKPLVHHWLSQQSMVLAWCPAQPKHGGIGASYVYLRQLR